MKYMLICPSCRRQFQTGTLTCTRCVIELLPPSMIELRDRHPELITVQPGHSRGALKDPYVELLQCSLNEAKEVSHLLEPEGIACLIEKDEGFRYEYRLEGGSHIADQQALIIKVKADQLPKARALLAWEIQQEVSDHVLVDDEDEPVLMSCPSCQAELPDLDETCIECGEALDPTNPEAPGEAELHRCSACGDSLTPEDVTCSACGARFDH